MKYLFNNNSNDSKFKTHLLTSNNYYIVSVQYNKTQIKIKKTMKNHNTVNICKSSTFYVIISSGGSKKSCAWW